MAGLQSVHVSSVTRTTSIAERVRWHVMPDPGALAATVAQQIRVSARAAIADRGTFRIVLAGGNTPAAVYRLLAGTDMDWTRWQVYFGDERCLPAGNTGRNSAMATQSWLDRVAIAPAHIHPIPAELGPEAGARSYAQTLREARPFDLVLLGMGEDGHTASLFPGHRHAASELVHPVHGAPKPPAERVSLSLVALNDAREVIVMATGRRKRDAIKRWRQGEELPVAGIHGRNGVDVYLDHEAGAALPLNTEVTG